jgi:hypothetical protein
MVAMSVSLEIGSKRVFASAIDWPGWSRGARDENGALEALTAYGPRYAAAVETAESLDPPPDRSALRVVERLTGNGGTDFGVPSVPAAHDEAAVDDGDLDRLRRLLNATWATFDRSAAAAEGRTLRKGPRGGGRDLDRIVDHVLEAEKAYLGEIGGDRKAAGDAGDVMVEIRRRALETLAARVHGEPPAPSRRRSPLWLPRYFVRRSAWHALDHAWEIEDRAEP